MAQYDIRLLVDGIDAATAGLVVEADSSSDDLVEETSLLENNYGTV